MCDSTSDIRAWAKRGKNTQVQNNPHSKVAKRIAALILQADVPPDQRVRGVFDLFRLYPETSVLLWLGSIGDNDPKVSDVIVTCVSEVLLETKDENTEACVNDALESLCLTNRDLAISWWQRSAEYSSHSRFIRAALLTCANVPWALKCSRFEELASDDTWSDAIYRAIGKSLASPHTDAIDGAKAVEVLRKMDVPDEDLLLERLLTV